MKLINYLIILTLFLLSSTFAKEKPPFKNILSHKEPKVYKEIIFEDRDGGKIDLKKINSDKIYILNFWATWCAPCVEEMPSLNRLQTNTSFNNLQIIPINVGRENIEKSKNFYKKLNINNLEIYFDKNVELASKFLLRGLPTTIFVNKKGEEFARIIGFVNFDDKKIIKWLQKYD